MSQSHMTRWIEIADERHFFEDAMVHESESDVHFPHLGDAIMKLSSLIHRQIDREPTRGAAH